MAKNGNERMIVYIWGLGPVVYKVCVADKAAVQALPCKLLELSLCFGEGADVWQWMNCPRAAELLSEARTETIDAPLTGMFVRSYILSSEAQSVLKYYLNSEDPHKGVYK